jgi:hypothetical protein
VQRLIEYPRGPSPVVIPLQGAFLSPTEKKSQPNWHYDSYGEDWKNPVQIKKKWDHLNVFHAHEMSVDPPK